MRTTHIREVAITAVAALAIAGGGAVLAKQPARLAQAPAAAPAEVTRPDTDTLQEGPGDQTQEGDQTTPDGTGSDANSEPAEATDTDAIESGDQTAPDASPASAKSATGRLAVATKKVHVAKRAHHAYRLTAAGASETAGENPETSGESSETGPSDGPGGHEDPAGNVDHQFDGEE